MRDLFLLAAFVGVAPLILRAPFIGLLAWIWVTLMNPQREVYGFLAGFELNQYIAILTALAWLASRESKLAHLNPMTVFLGLFGLWGCVATYFALDFAHSYPIADRTIKTIILAAAVVTLVTTKARLQAVIWVCMIAIGYYAVKGGAFVVVTHGAQRVYGPDNSMISDNNSLGLALIVFLPLMNHLRATSRVRAVRWACLTVMAAALLAVFGTYSRGALVTLAAAAAAYALRTRYGMVLVAVGAISAAALPSVLPVNWMNRMSTIQAYDQDSSFEGRVAAWRTSTNIALARPLVGGGFAAVEVDGVTRQFRSEGSLEHGRAAHSIYFQVLGDMGFVGLGLYLLMLASSWLNTVLVQAAARGRPELRWADSLARMMQVSMMALLVGGSALSMAYYDGFILMLTLTACLLQVVRRPAVAALGAAPAPRWKVAAPSGIAAGAH